MVTLEIAMPRARMFLLATLLALPLAACGNKGQLVLPDQQPKKHKSAAPAQKPPEAKPADAGTATDAGH